MPFTLQSKTQNHQAGEQRWERYIDDGEAGFRLESATVAADVYGSKRVV